MRKHYLRLSDFNLIGWLENYKDKIEASAEALGLAEAEAAEAVSWCDSMIKIIKEMDDIRHMYRSTSEKKRLVLKEGKNFIQNQVKRVKSVSEYTEAIGQDLGIVSTIGSFNANEFRPEIKLNKLNGVIEVAFTKGETDGVNIYRKTAEEKEWTLVCNKVRSPFYDNINFKSPLKLEYKACAHIDYKPVGLESYVETIII